MKYTFSASRVTGGNAVFPDQLVIDDDAQMVTIETNGGVTILANGFTRSDANTIVNLLNRQLSIIGVM